MTAPSSAAFKPCTLSRPSTNASHSSLSALSEPTMRPRSVALVSSFNASNCCSTLSTARNMRHANTSPSPPAPALSAAAAATNATGSFNPAAYRSAMRTTSPSPATLTGDAAISSSSCRRISRCRTTDPGTLAGGNGFAALTACNAARIAEPSSRRAAAYRLSYTGLPHPGTAVSSHGASVWNKSSNASAHLGGMESSGSAKARMCSFRTTSKRPLNQTSTNSNRR